ncbi:hypothetical protein [Lapillicoccus sp.]|uniref:sensor histidine kinase n=1 Tax=Lapillicoccus sp. TaxID=1909287 RepID=UPI0032659E5A
MRNTLPEAGRRCIRLLHAEAWGLRLGAALCTVALSAFAVALVVSQNAGTGAAGAILAMILPVVFARRAPSGAAATLAVATLANGLLFGHLVRCGAALPAAFFVAYVVAEQLPHPRRWPALGLVLTGVVLQCGNDPQLGWSQIPIMVATTLMFFAGGAAIHARVSLIRLLRERNAELSRQRERTAQAKIATNRERVHDGLTAGIRLQIHQICRLTRECQAGTAQPDVSLAEIERLGRSTLHRMRDVVGTMHFASTEPEPALGNLAELVRTATACRVHLTVEGEVRTLPASVELSGYRIVEQLVAALRDDPAADARVRVGFEPAALDLRVTGPAGASDRDTGMRAIHDRAALHAGTVVLSEPNGRLDAHVRLPVFSSHG